jgi:hypothetical protein
MSGLSWAFVLVVSLPAAALYNFLPNMDLNAPGQLVLLGMAATNATPLLHVSLLAMTALSWGSILLGYVASGGTTRFRRPPSFCTYPLVNRRAWIVTCVIVMISISSVVTLMQILKQESFGALVGFITSDYRVNWTASTKGFFDALAFALINSMLPLAFLGLTIQTRWRTLRYLIILPLAVILLLMCGSRRAATVLLLVTLMSQLPRNRIMALSIAFALPIIIVIMVLFGRAIPGMIGGEERSATEVLSDRAWDHAGYISSELAISQTASLSTMTWFDNWPRMGVDHVLSVLRLLPEQSIFGTEFTQRFTRHATNMHIGDPGANDIPVGFIGAVWVDGYWLGVIVLPLALGLFAGRFDRWIHSRDGISGPGWYAIAYLNFTVYFQTLNSGTLDFTMSPTNVFAALMCAFLLAAHPAVRRQGAKIALGLDELRHV